MRLTVWLGGQTPFEDVAEVLWEVGRISMSTGSAWRLMKRWGEVAKAAEEERVDQVHRLPRREEVVPGEAKRVERMGVGMDGAMLYVLGEGWKEFKVGSVFDIEQRPTFVEETLEWELLGHAVNNSYMAHLGGPERFGQKVWAVAQQRHWTQAWETEALGDGANWIWNQVEEHFYDSRTVVDWYHGTEHLAQAGECLYGVESSPAKERWLNEQKRILYQGHATQVAQVLRQQAAGRTDAARDGLLQEASYFENNERRMHYLELREDGWLIGSGMVESGAKQYKDRLTGPGMRWSRPGAERLLPIRSAVMSHSFDPLWRTIYNSPNN